MHKTEPLRKLWKGLDPYKGVTGDPGPPMGFKQDMGPLKRILNEVKPKRILEIGSHCGASAIFMAQNSEAEILCVDSWCLKPDQMRHDLRRWGYAFDRFRAAVVGHGLQDRITYLPMRSEDAIPFLHEEGFKFDLVYVDGDHTGDAPRWDIFLAFFLAPVVVVDDFNEAFPDVIKGVERAIADYPKRYMKRDGHKVIIYRDREQEWRPSAA